MCTITASVIPGASQRPAHSFCRLPDNKAQHGQARSQHERSTCEAHPETSIPRQGGELATPSRAEAPASSCASAWVSRPNARRKSSVFIRYKLRWASPHLRRPGPPGARGPRPLRRGLRPTSVSTPTTGRTGTPSRPLPCIDELDTASVRLRPWLRWAMLWSTPTVRTPPNRAGTKRSCCSPRSAALRPTRSMRFCPPPAEPRPEIQNWRVHSDRPTCRTPSALSPPAAMVAATWPRRSPVSSAAAIGRCIPKGGRPAKRTFA